MHTYGSVIYHDIWILGDYKQGQRLHCALLLMLYIQLWYTVEKFEGPEIEISVHHDIAGYIYIILFLHCTKQWLSLIFHPEMEDMRWSISIVLVTIRLLDLSQGRDIYILDLSLILIYEMFTSDYLHTETLMD